MLLTLGLIPILVIIHTLKPKPRPVEVTNLFLWQAVLKERNANLSFDRLKKNLPLILQILIMILDLLDSQIGQSDSRHRYQRQHENQNRIRHSL